ncbi:MAG TPA: hypothetical protein VJM53_02960 [Burkholderiales bacterium]|nr:hypothetical protein [Burkholderiales bacterium]
MQTLEADHVIQLQKQFRIFVGKTLYTVAEAEALGLIEVQVHENGGLSYSERPTADSQYDTLTLR